MKYIAFFDTLDYLAEKRSFGLSSVNVVEYMAEVLSNIDDYILIVSPTRTLLTKGFFRGRKTSVKDRIDLVQPPTFGVKTRIGRIFAVLFTQIWLFSFLLQNIKKGESVVVYHSLSLMNIIKLIKKIKKISLTLEVREIYTDINKSNEQEKRKEFSFFSVADKFIFPTELLNKKVNIYDKPYVIATGIYRSEKITQNKFNDGKIHIVYAGTLRIEKGGALTTVRMAEYLDERFYVHILGNGTDKEKDQLINEIEKVKKNSTVSISYDGVLRGDDFKHFLQKCHLGLSTQNPEGEYNDTSFPSKILTYLANGLDVLSVKIPAVESSPVGSCVYYYEGSNPELIAETIKNIEWDVSVDKGAYLDSLNTKLILNLKRLFN
jgi:hypothetical protein